jgi:hypothetical protein
MEGKKISKTALLSGNLTLLAFVFLAVILGFKIDENNHKYFFYPFAILDIILSITAFTFGIKAAIVGNRPFSFDEKFEILYSISLSSGLLFYWCLHICI